MTLKAIPFLVTALTYFFLGAWIILTYQNKAQRLYGALCISTCFWQGVWVLLFSNFPGIYLYFWVKVFYSVILFVPSTFYHFIVEFTQKETRPKLKYCFYAISGLLMFSIWIGKGFLRGLNIYSWGAAPKAGLIHPLFVILISVAVVRIFHFLQHVRADEKMPLKRDQATIVLAALLLYAVSAIDLFSNYGISIFPLSCLFTAIAFVLFTYAMLRYELLSIATSYETDDELRRRNDASIQMNKMGMMTAFPLVSQGEVLGYLLLGEKMSEESYSREDLLLLRIVANQAALAYQRVRFLEMAVRGARTEMLGEIAGGFAHEIKTPLANISLPAELTFIDLNDVEQGKRKIEDVLPELKQRMKDIMQQAFKASDKIEAIRQFSKPGQVHLEQVELGKILQNSLSLLDHVIRKTAISIKTEFPTIISPIRGNAKQLEIVFVNLIKNAAEAMAGAISSNSYRNLVLKGQEEGGWIIVSVKDSGPGIKRTDIGHLFEAYFTTKGSSGTGMGLFLSHQVIKAHGGSIEVKSEEGHGTEFIVKLPKYVSESRAGVHEAA